MTETKVIAFCLTKEEFDLLQSKMNALGYRSMSDLVRDSCLGDLYGLELIKEIHEKTCQVNYLQIFS
ncbi:hypothetical protein JXA48_05180 [Candidatus Woesearchaeota archaeon]|nr:hypothetical protein [Candidatus Woesearchaeota archaeon]